MSQLIKPLNNDVSSAQSTINNQKQNQNNFKITNPLKMMGKVENTNSNVKVDVNDSEITILKIMLMISFFFQISIFVLIVVNFQLRLLGLVGESKIIGLEITCSLLSLISFISYMYSFNLIDDLGLQSLSKLFKISLLFTLLTLVLGICVFSITETEDLSCYITDQECLVKISSELCNTNKVSSCIKYIIQLFSDQQNLENSSSQKLISNPDAQANLLQYKIRGYINPFKIESTTKKSCLFAQQNISANVSANNISNDQL
ncbi:hypothetical protein ABPG72_016710 [Tetrahymena utriculariae]